MDFDRKDQQGVVGLSFDRPTDMIGETVRRFAGQPFPAELQRVKSALFDGLINLEDDDARVSISPTGQFEIKSKTSNWSLGLDPVGKGFRIGYDSRQAESMPQVGGLMPEEPATPSAGRTYADEVIRQYREKNPGYYRP